MRPSALAADDTPDWPVFAHALEWLREHEGFEPSLVVHLRPTSPLRRVADLDRAVDLLAARPDADSIRWVCDPFQNPVQDVAHRR